ncbi:MAG TPA: methionyl-tRNA formyltransferase [Membranihabitans sp.]|nr:methionyl-tRNA formyltransferase [Membranihabitans sp.]
MNIVFMGTPEFAVPVLKSLHLSDHTVQAVVTIPDQRGGRNKSKRLEPAVKKYAVEHGLEVLQPLKLNQSTFLHRLRKLKPDVIVVVAFRKLPKLVWSIPRLGTINLHASLLPAYRGAAPINHAVIQGQKVTGLTTFLIDEQIDTGNILLQKEIHIEEDDTAGDVYERMMAFSGELVLKTLAGLEDGSIEPQPQNDALASPAPKVYFDQNELDFNQPVRFLYNFIRGMSPYPATWTTYRNKILKIYFAEPVWQPHDENPGTVKTDYKSYFRIYAKDGYLEIKDLQWEGKRRMHVKDFLNGLTRDE